MVPALVEEHADAFSHIEGTGVALAQGAQAPPAVHVAEVVPALTAPRIGQVAEVISPIRAREVEVDLAAHLVRVGDRAVVMTSLELRILALLVANAGRAVTKAELSLHGWGETGAPAKAIEVYILRIRRRIDPDPAGTTYIRTVRGVGYIFDR